MPTARGRWGPVIAARRSGLDKIMDGNLDEIIDALATHEQAEKLRQLNAQAE